MTGKNCVYIYLLDLDVDFSDLYAFSNVMTISHLLIFSCSGMNKR